MADPLAQQERLIARRMVPMQQALLRWMLKRAREEAARQIAQLRHGGPGWTVAKAREVIAKLEPVDPELLEILMRFGVAQAETASMRIGSAAGVERLVNPRVLQRALASKDFKLKLYWELDEWGTRRVRQISADTKQMVRDSVNRILGDASQEQPLPSAGEMARRIRTQFHGEDLKGRLYAFSPERAATIARTELVQAENTGAVEGYKAAGVKRIRWLAKTDGRSGDRHHEQMHGVEINLGELFTMPSGRTLRYPGDPEGDISETANCRCATRAVIVRGAENREVGT